RAVRTEVPAWLQGPRALRTSQTQPMAAAGTDVKINRNRTTASRAESTHLTHLCDDAQQLLGGGNPGLHLSQPIFAQRNHSTFHRGLADQVFSRALRDEPAHPVV